MIAIVANPVAHNFSSDKLRYVTEKLKNANLHTDVFFTQKAGDGTEIAKTLEGKYKIIAGFGGDGIINEIINAPLKKSALAVLPAGTTNVLAIEIFGKPNLRKATEALIGGKTKKAYICKISNKRFILMAGMGFDAESVYNVNTKIKKLSGKLSYILAGIKSYFNSKSSCFEIVVGSKNYKVLWAIVSNAKKYAGNFNISHKTNIFKPTLDVLLCYCNNKTWALPYCNAILFGGFHRFNLPYAKHITTKYPIFIKGEPIIQIDGDYLGKTPARIEIEMPIEIIV